MYTSIYCNDIISHLHCTSECGRILLCVAMHNICDMAVTKGEKKMEHKKVQFALGIFIVAGVCVNVYLFNSNNSLKNKVVTMESDIENNKSESSSIDNSISIEKNRYGDLSSQLEELQSTLNGLESDKESLLDNLEKLKTTKEGLKESSVDNSAAQDSEERSIQQIADRMMAEHPEWFDEDGNIVIGGGSGYTQGDYEHVGTPDSGELPTYDMNAVTSDVAPGTVY